jgi:hypothetical protein
MVSGELRMMPCVSGLSVYGAMSAAPHEPSAPESYNSRWRLALGNGGGKRTVSKELDAPEIEPAVDTVIC